MPVCEGYWGDCNGDYRDGCETPIKHRDYCDGDPRINAASAPSATFVPDGDGTGPGSFNAATFSRGLERVRPGLELCYRKLLVGNPRLKGAFSYRLTVAGTACISAELVRSDLTSQELEACVLRALANARFTAGPEGGAVTYSYSVVFHPGSGT